MIIVDIVIRSSVVLLAALLGSLALGRHSAALRHRVIAAGIFAAVSVGPLSAVLPDWNAPAWSVELIEFAGAGVSTLGNEPDAASAETAPAVRARGGEPAAVSPVSLAQAAVVVWIVGVLVSLGVILRAILQLARLTKTATPIADDDWRHLSRVTAAHHGVWQAIALLKTTRADTLATWGLRRPCILLPSDCERWTRARLTVVFNHELAHIARRDWAVQMAAEVIRALFWFNPLFWIACAHLRRESELACDVAVIAAGTAPDQYASELVAIARTCRSSTPRVNAAMSMARPSTLEWRITAMLNTTLARAIGSPRARAIAVAALAAITIPVASFRAFEQVGPLPLTGTVYDTSHAVLPGVAVSLEDGNGIVRDAVTDSSGRFQFEPVAAGDYWIETKVMGFRTLRQQVTLRSARNWQRAITLQVGTLQETVTITGSAPPPPPPGAGGAAPPGTNAPLRVGGNIKAPMKVRDVRPVYPQEMQDGGYEGVVAMEAVIGVDGSVVSIRVQSSQAHPDLAEAAAEAVRQWQFTPTLLNGVAVEVAMNVTVQFKL